MSASDKEDRDRKIDEATVFAAARASAAPVLANRFELFPSGQDDMRVLCLGGVVAVQGVEDESPGQLQVFATMPMAFAIDRKLGIKLCLGLMSEFSIGADDLKAASESRHVQWSETTPGADD